MFKKKFDIIDFFQESHQTDIIETYPEIDIFVPIHI
jgi:hypothetical protein